MFLPEVAEQFQLANITALIYDPRSIGLSDGMPRNDIDPMKQVEDYSDALTFLSTIPIVDPARICFWGMSFSGGVALCAAALDKRAKCAMVICPLFKYYADDRLPKVLSMAMKDRESQAKGNKPYSPTVFTSKGDNPAGMAVGGGHEAYDYIVSVKRRGAQNHENRTTIQTYYRMAMWQPHGLFKLVQPTPVMMVVPECDIISRPEDQMAVFNALSGRKRLHIAQGKGHMNVLSGEDFPEIQRLLVEFMHDVFGQAVR